MVRFTELDPALYGATPGTGEDMTRAFRSLFDAAAETEGEKTVRIAPGVYDFYPDFAERKTVYISNTVSEREMPVPVRTVPLRISGVKNLTVEAEGAEFLMRGAMTNLVLENSENVVLRGAAFDSAEPAVAEAEVAEVKGFSAVFRFSEETKLKIERGRPVFTGSNFLWDTAKNARFQWANVRMRADEPDRILRARHPFAGARRYDLLGGNMLKVSFWGAPRVREGDRFALHDTTRREVGILVNECKNVVFDGVREYFNLSHAYIAQVSENIALRGCHNAPRPGSGRFTASQTDFCHFSMCKGRITVKNCVFDGAFDDVLNVHGFHFKLLKADVDTIRVRFMHPQSYGFRAFFESETIGFTRPDTLLPVGKPALVQAVKTIDKYVFELLLDRAVEREVVPGLMVENLSRCASLDFIGNRCSRVTTRGVLATTRGKVRIEDNEFFKLGMSGVLISDDAKSWYESGAVRDVSIRGNRFVDCGGQAVRIMPEYSVYEGAVHKNIAIEENEIISEGSAIRVKGAENVAMRKNLIWGEPGKNGFIVTEECENVKLTENIIKD